MALISGCVCGSCPDGQCVGCVRGGELCLPNDPGMRTPRMLSEIGIGISKTRGVPGMGSTNYGPRGQKQTFRRFAGEDRSLSTMSSTKYLTGLLSVGVLFFIVGYGLQKGRLIA